MPFEILKEKKHELPNQIQETYVIVRFFGSGEAFDDIETVRAYQIPSDMSKDDFLQEKYNDWLKACHAEMEF